MNQERTWLLEKFPKLISMSNHQQNLIQTKPEIGISDTNN